MLFRDTNIGRLIMDEIHIEKTANKPLSPKYIKDAEKISAGLEKVASLPYREEVYDSVQEILKIASSCIKELNETLNSTSSKNLELEKAAEVRVLIDDMLQFGAVDEHNLQEKIAELMRKTPHELDIIKEAVKLNTGRGTDGNNLFEKNAGTSVSLGKSGIFDSVID